MTLKEYDRVIQVHPYLSHLIKGFELADIKFQEDILAKSRLPSSYEIQEAFATFVGERKRLKKLDLNNKDLIESIRDEVVKNCEIFSIIIIKKTTSGKKCLFIFNRPRKGRYFRAMEDVLK